MEVVAAFDGLPAAHVPCPAWTSEHLRILVLTAPRQQDVCGRLRLSGLGVVYCGGGWGSVHVRVSSPRFRPPTAVSAHASLHSKASPVSCLSLVLRVAPGRLLLRFPCVDRRSTRPTRSLRLQTHGSHHPSLRVSHVRLRSRLARSVAGNVTEPSFLSLVGHMCLPDPGRTSFLSFVTRSAEMVLALAVGAQVLPPGPHCVQLSPCHLGTASLNKAVNFCFPSLGGSLQGSLPLPLNFLQQLQHLSLPSVSSSLKSGCICKTSLASTSSVLALHPILLVHCPRLLVPRALSWVLPPHAAALL